MKVFFTGTENLKSLNLEIIERINTICKLEGEILIGNYRGFDQLALTYLKLIGYPNVTIYETGSKLSFGYQLVDAGKYPAQDIKMSQEADFMLAVHDGSKGVATNLGRMPRNRIRVITV
ncbi:hypothetical protein [Cylindrospermum sp. FACHB-282]|uniref:hypothetical protein n=1 Tax=Cylindrospermum sp. FACHB-282 TaxID=2692794 RepID=UPI001682FE2B|nr:hypothetical protein [Cylindrospermum sp. FACHB-282]MBD2386017.1 hypothetical protein [Cylindrospermum sp. FACHB-282]